MSPADGSTKITVTLDPDIHRWAQLEAARRGTTVEHLILEILREHMRSERRSVAKAAKRLAGFGKRHRLSLGGVRAKDLVNKDRR